MASRDRIIAAACEAYLDRRLRSDEAKVARVRERVGGTPADLAAAEFWYHAIDGVAGQADEAGMDGRQLVSGILASKRHLAAL